MKRQSPDQAMRRMKRQARRGAVRFTDSALCAMLGEDVCEEDVLRALSTADEVFLKTSDEGSALHCYLGLDLNERALGVLCRFQRSCVRVEGVIRT